MMRELVLLGLTLSGAVAALTLRLTVALGTVVPGAGPVVVGAIDGTTVVDVSTVEIGRPRSMIIGATDALSRGCFAVPADPRERRDTGENKGATFKEESEAGDLSECSAKLGCLSFASGALLRVVEERTRCFGTRSCGIGVNSLTGTSSARGVGMCSVL